LLARGEELAPADLGLQPAPATSPPHTPGDEPDRAAIESALDRAGGVLAQAASDLGMSRQALYRRLDRLGIRRD
jgi:transcriptional regulator of acetoin/glycerol metabolism